MGYWIWVTRPDYYLDRFGNEVRMGESDALWTCSAETRVGDQILLYRTAPKSDIKYLLEAASGPEPIRGGEFNGQTGCQYRLLETYEVPLAIADMRSDKLLAKDFTALRSRFQGRAFAVDPSVWSRLTELLRDRNR